MSRRIFCRGLVVVACLLVDRAVAGEEARPRDSAYLRALPTRNPHVGKLRANAFPWDGVQIQRWQRDAPPARWTVCWIDLATPGLGYCVSDVHYSDGPGGFPVQAARAQTTVDFLRDHDASPRVDLAVNTVAYYFVPAYDGQPVFLSEPIWQRDDRNAEPELGSLMLGLLKGRAVVGPLAEVRLARPICAFTGFEDSGKSPGGIAVRDGRALAFDVPEPHGRTLAGVTEGGRVLILVTAEGYHPGVSDGLSLSDSAEVLHAAGASQGIFLDGGGSSLLVGRGDTGPALFNQPAGLLNTPGTLRYIAVSLGFTDLRRTGEPLPAVADWEASAPVVAVCKAITWSRAYPRRSFSLLTVVLLIAGLSVTRWLCRRGQGRGGKLAGDSPPNTL